jgi:hypothetical protein
LARDYFFSFGLGAPSVNASLSPTFITFVNGSGSTFTPPSITEQFPGSGIYHVTYGATQTMAFVMDGATSGLATTDRYITGVFDPYDQFGVTLNAAYALGVTSVALGTLNFAIGTSTLAIDTLNFGLGSTNFALNTLAFAQGATIFTLESQGNTLIAALGLTMIGQGVTIVSIGNTLLGIGGSFGAIALAIGSTASSIGSTGVDPVDLYGFLKRAQEIAEGNQIYTKATGLFDLYNRGGSTLLREKTITDSSVNTTKT